MCAEQVRSACYSSMPWPPLTAMDRSDGGTNGRTGKAEAKLSIFGALKLYLDFIDLFLFTLRLLGRPLLGRPR